MVELDQFKVTLNSYAEPLVEVRDSLRLNEQEDEARGVKQTHIRTGILG